MGELSIWHWLVVLIVILLLFGSGKMSSLMGDFAKGIKAFRRGMQDEPESKPEPRTQPEPPAKLAATTATPAPAAAEKTPLHHEA